MNRLLEWLQASNLHSATLCQAEGKTFCRLSLPGRWRITQKEFPIEFTNGHQHDSVFDCIGYGETFDSAIDEAFSKLP